MTSHKTRSHDKPTLPPVTTKCVACGEQFTAEFMALALGRLATHQDGKCGL